ncbi:MAG TPA: RDD family protein [Candidatus Limnocylindrales bacterium]|nr:RDD family protein [Candidatus Limnocylindrales bacterium]
MSSLTDTRPVAGPAGFFYADVPNRVIAMVIDVIGIIVIQAVLVGILAGGAMFTGGFTAMFIVANLVAYALWAAYFIYTWSTMRGTLGMKVLGLQVGHQADGRNLTYQQSAIRFAVLFGPQIVIGLLGALVPALAGLGLLSFVWLVVILVTMAQSPTKQGLHDRYSESMVVKAGRAVGG